MLHFKLFKRRKLSRNHRRIQDFHLKKTQNPKDEFENSFSSKTFEIKTGKTESQADNSYFQRCLNNITNILGTNKSSKQPSIKSLKIKPLDNKMKKQEDSSQSTTSDISTIKSLASDKKPAINKSFILRKLHKNPNDRSLGSFSNLKEFKPKITGRNNCNLRSSIYCTDGKNIVYHISFYAINCRIFPLYLEKRKGADFKNDKEIQSENHFFYKTKFFINSSKFIILKKFYFIPSKYKKKFDRLKGITPPVKVYFKTDSYKGKSKKVIKNPVCGNLRYPTTSGEIFLLWDNINIKVKAEMFKLESIKQNWMLNMKKGGHCNSLAQVITRYKNDIIEFKFHMAQVQIQEITPHASRGCQVRDSQAYIPYISDINNRRVILALPFTQYFYKNPMTEIFRCNWINALNKREPRWVTELRHLRQNKIVNEDFNALMNKILEQHHSTEIQIDIIGTVYRIKGNILLVKKISSDATYEMFAQERQRQMLMQETGKLDSSHLLMNLIPDWDLEENTV